MTGFQSLVDQTHKFSNLLEDLRKVEKFAQYVDNQGSENMTEKEGSQKQTFKIVKNEG